MAIAFAIYSETDNSLNFYKQASEPTVGSTFNDKIVTAIYTDIETNKYTYTSDTDNTIPWFLYSQSIKTVTIVDGGISPISTALWFYKCSVLTGINNLDKLDMSVCTDTSNMFNGCSSLTTIDGINSIDMSYVTTVYRMFQNCALLTSLNLGNWNTSNMTSFYYMFNGCSNLVNLDVDNFNTSKVTSTQGMFYNCSSLTSLNLNSFDTSKVTNIQSMFYNCSSLTSLNLSNFDTSNVITSPYLFYGCSSLTSLNLSDFDTSKVTSMKSMFCNCSGLTSLNISGFDTSNVTTMSYMFYGCSNLTSLNLSNFDTSKVTDMSYMFYNCSKLTSIFVRDILFDINQVLSSNGMFYGCTSLPNFSSSLVTKIKAIDISEGGYLTFPTTFLAKRTDLNSVASTIRTKAGTSGKFSFPDGFINAINNLKDVTVTIDDEKVTNDLELKTERADIRLPDTSFSLINTCAVLADDGIHLLGGNINTSGTGHYLYDGSSWISRKVIPYTITPTNSYCAILSGAGKGIHVMGSGVNSTSAHQTNHYAFKYSSSGGATVANTWTSVSTLPYNAVCATAVALNNTIHLFGGNSGSTSHYQLKGGSTSWNGRAAVPYACTGCKAVVYNGKIHIIGGNGSSTNKLHYAYDDVNNTWTAMATVPVGITEASATVLEDGIHIYGGTANRTNHYIFDGSSWTKAQQMTVKHTSIANAAVSVDGEAHLFGCNYDTASTGVAYSNMHVKPYTSYYIKA